MLYPPIEYLVDTYYSHDTESFPTTIGNKWPEYVFPEVEMMCDGRLVYMQQIIHIFGIFRINSKFPFIF